MTEKGLAILIVSAITIAALLVAGCVQGTGSSTNQGTAGSQTTSPAQQTQNAATPAAGSPHQYQGQSFLSNTTLLTAAAQTLGVSESDLANALTPTPGAHFNLTTAAAQISAESGTTITADQLRAALGIPTGGFAHRGGYNATLYNRTPETS
jgi:hypothetical protein